MKCMMSSIQLFGRFTVSFINAYVLLEIPQNDVFLYFLKLECCIEYIELWLQNCQGLLNLEWIILKKCPKWEDIDRTAGSLIEKRFFDENDHQKLFNCYDYLKQYCDEDKLKRTKKF